MWVLMQSPMESEDQRALTARERLNIQKQRSCWGRKGCLLGFAGVCEFSFLPPDPCVFSSKSQEISFLKAGFFRKKSVLSVPSLTCVTRYSSFFRAQH